MERARIETLNELQGKEERGHHQNNIINNGTRNGPKKRPSSLKRSKSNLPSYEPPPTYEEALRIKKYYQKQRQS